MRVLTSRGFVIREQNSVSCVIERFSNDCRKSNPNQSEQRDEPIKFLAISCSLLKAQEKSREEGAIGFGFTSHWFKNWRESFKLKNGIRVITFDSHFKTALL